MNEEELNKLRHSAAHLLAASVLELYPNTKLTIGPSIENGFYYDFDFGDTKVSEEDLPKIEKKMHEIVKNWDSFEKTEVDYQKAKEDYNNNPYKLELIEEIKEKAEPLTYYKSGMFSDLCHGGHVSNPKESLKHFKLLSIAGAYWKGNEKNKMLTRIYGTAFKTQKELDDYLVMVEEAKKRDHKKLGKELGLFVFSDVVGKGLPLWTPKGAAIRRELEKFIVNEEIQRGYEHVVTPNLASLELYKKSGHYPYYKDTMYAPIKIENEQFMLRPMSCPHHFELYLSSKKSYRDLPVRYAELANLYRFEKSGELSGLQRVRSFTLADAHIIARKNQAEEEINNVLDLIEYIANVFGLKPGTDYHYRLSLGNREDDKKYFKDDKSWNEAEEILRSVLKRRKANFVEAEDEAAFYGPKIDVQMKNVNGKEDTAFTVQYDFVMPKRFGLTYVNEEGKEEQPIVIHRSSIGAIERVMAFLIEHYAGKFPIWLSPVQIILLPIAERHQEKALEANKFLKENGIRSEVDLSNDTLGAKIRGATLQKIPYLGIIGDKEIADQNSNGLLVSIRTREGKDEGQIRLKDLIQRIKEEIDKKV